MEKRPGIFTTLRARSGELWLWPDHLARLRDGAGRLGLGAPDASALEGAIAARLSGLDDARVRITLRAGEAPRIDVEAYSSPLLPWRLRIVEASPSSPHEDTINFKTTRRGRYDEARRAARDADDALLVAGGDFLECTVANLFFLAADGRLLTPPAYAPILPGIARARVLAAARAMGLEAAESPVAADSAVAAVDCFVTNALFLVHPVATIAGVGRYSESASARQLRDAVIQTAPRKRIIQ